MTKNNYTPAGLGNMFFTGSRTKMLRSFGKEVNRPYMKEREIEIFKEILIKNKPARVLEYGCGYSSIYYPQFLPETSRWFSVEHNQEWGEYVKKRISAKTTLSLVPPDNATYKDDGYEGDFTSYVEKGKEFAPFDLILVDGMAREVCIDYVYDLLTDDGLLIVHDANRPCYREAMKKYKHVNILEDYRKTAGGMAFLTKSNPITDYFDIERHKKIWKTASF
ncbi:MAG: hypothetical protein LUG18_01785 [Candidatus Azobacteroides sp.]|nr:hypothetical protein [Candidatus Azobacteroides sp.]